MRTHITKQPIVLPLSDMDPGSGHIAMKPAGFWYELHGEWRDWCAEEEYLDVSEHMVYEVDLSDCRIRTITSLEEAIAFSEEFRYRRVDWPSSFVMAIDWRRAALGFDGIEVSWYERWQMLMTHSLEWLYSWDCRSGCVWNASKVKVGSVAERKAGKS
jgi:hypothetical protein